MIFKKHELKHLWPFYFYYLAFGLGGMIFPFFVIYFQGFSFSYTQIVSLLAAYSISIVLFEIPTGGFADGWSRKKSVILGFILGAIITFIIPYTSNFYILLLLFAILGFSMTLVSGAEEAWVIDNLNHKRKKELITEFYIKSQSIAAFGAIVAPLIGAVIVSQLSMSLLWIGWSVAFITGAFILLLFAKEHYVPKGVTINSLIRESYSNTKKGISHIKKNKHLLFLLLSIIFIVMSTADSDFWQPFFVDIGYDPYTLGIIFSIASFFMMVIPFIARSLEKYDFRITFTSILVIRTIILGGVLLIVPSIAFIGILIFIFTQSIVSLRFPIIDPVFQKKLPKKIRATITSIKSMVTQLSLAIASLIAGVIADIIGAQQTIAFTGLIGLLAIYFIWKVKE